MLVVRAELINNDYEPAIRGVVYFRFLNVPVDADKFDLTDAISDMAPYPFTDLDLEDVSGEVPPGEEVVDVYDA